MTPVAYPARRAAWTLFVVAAFGCKDPSKASGLLTASAVATAPSSTSPPARQAPSGDPDQDAASAAAAPSAHAKSGVPMKLLDAGQPPRRKLRYVWNLDQKEQLLMDLRTAASQESAGAKQAEVPLPSVHIAIAIDPQSISSDGDLRYAWRVTSASVEAQGDTPTEVTEGMRVEVAAVKSLSGSALVTARGLAREVSVEPGPAAEGATGQMAEQVRQTLRDVAAPLPEEEVGVGARWRKVSQLDDRDTRVAQTETFRLVELQTDRGTLSDALAQTAPPQTLHAPGGPASAHARMESMLASGEAKIRFDLSRLVPQTTFDGITTMVLSGRSPGDSARSVRMIMHVFIAIAGSRR